MIYKVLFIVFFIFLNTHFDLTGQEPTFIPAKYNVLLIMVDDLRPELGCYGKSHVFSPNIDRLANRGQLFEDAYSNMPSCGPSRASLMSGLYPDWTRFVRWNCSQDVDVPGLVSLPMHLRNNGYKTISLGKVYNNFDDGRGSWDMVWKPPITTTEMWDYQSKEGIDIFNDRNKNRQYNSSSRNYNHVPKKSIAYERPDVDDLTYVDGRCASKAMEILADLKHESQPFFLAVGFNKPHLPYNAPDRYWRIYDDMNLDSIRTEYSSSAPNVSKLAFHNNYEFRSHQNIPNESNLSDSTLNQLFQGYLACISYTDSQIGRILNALEYLKMEENTLIILWSDHGYHLGENQMWGKATNYRVSSRIPFIVKLPRNMNHVIQKGLIESVDIYPTVCDLLGIPAPFHLQGKSFAPKIMNPEVPGKGAVFVRMNISGGKYHETIIGNSYSLTEFYDKDHNMIEAVLYDLKSDPAENHNVIDSNNIDQVRNDLTTKLHQHMIKRNMIKLSN